jgi:acetyl-CoA carboxylase biotin carboxyl carrier protein
MLTYEQILELLDRFENSQLDVLDLQQAEFRLRMKRRRRRQPRPGEAPTKPELLAEAALVEVQSPSDAADPAVDEGANAHVLSSPIVGTFYAAPSPDEAHFVKVGDRVKKGQVVCIVEAMKMMNEIEADLSGEVVRVVASNGEPIGYGDPILLLQPE